MPVPRRDWFEMLVTAVKIPWAILALVNMAQFGGSTLNSLPAAPRYAFAAILGIAASLTVYGITRFAHASGPLYERAGLLMLCSLDFVYAAWAIYAVGLNGFALLLTGLGVACVLRARDINKARKVAVR